MEKLSKLFTVGLVIGSLISAVSAQSFKATIVGKVLDPNGAPVSGANVTVTQEETNFTRTITSDEGGNYVVPQLQPGKYSVKVGAPGFKIYLNSNVVVETDQTFRLDVGLEVGSVNETVTVQGEPPTINTETSEKSDVIVQRQVQELPLNGRDFTDLAKLVPGIYQRPTDDDQGQGLASAGTRTDSTNYSLDGISNRSDRNGGVGVNTSVDSIQEFKVSTSTYSAELGRLAGAQISVVSKSGTNRYSGTAFEYIRNDFFDATNALASPDEDKTLRRHQFGGTFGGPLPFLSFGESSNLFDSGKDKMFFFTSFEQTREVRSTFSDSVAPNASWVQGDFSNVLGAPRTVTLALRSDGQPNCAGPVGTVVTLTNRDSSPLRVNQLNNPYTGLSVSRCDPTTGRVASRVEYLPFSGNIIPQNLISPISRAILPFLPVANSSSSLDGYQFSVVTNVLPRNLFSLKIDRKLTDNNNLYFRISADNQTAYKAQLGRVNYPGFLRNWDYKQYSLALGDTHSFRPNLINEFRVGYLSQDNKTVNENNDVDYIGQLGIPGLPTGQLPEWQGFPAIRIDGFPDTGDSANTPFNYIFKNLSIYDAVTWILGDHNLKVGIDVVRPNYIETDIRNVRGDFRFRGRNTTPGGAATNGFYSYADFLLGLPDSTQRQLGAEAADLTAWQSAFYIQDNWRVTDWLTLNLGLRYDYTPFLYEKSNRLSNFVPELGMPVCADGELRNAGGALVCRDAASIGLPRALVKTDTNNWAPRFGFALKPFKGNKTVIRGGAGIFYSTETINPARQQLANNYPYLFRQQFSRSSSNPLLLTFQNPFPGAGSLQGLTTPQGIPTDSQTPEVYQYNLTLERELTEDLGFEIGYVGSQGRFLGMRYNLNTAYPTGAISSTGTPITARAFPALGDITYQTQEVNSNYNAMQAVIRRRSKNGLTLLASYTFGKAMDQNSNTNNSTTGSQRNPQDIRNFRDEWGLADYHRTHQFSASFNYDLPFGRGHEFFGDARGWSQVLLGGWQLNGIATMLSGRPFTPVYSVVDTSAGRPDLVGDPMSNIPPGLFFNPAAFAHPRATAGDPNLYGNSGRNILIGPDFRSVDLSLFKNIRFTEKARIQLRWEVFNVLNRPNFQIPQHLLETSDQGQFRQTSNEAREMQFAAKIIF